MNKFWVLLCAFALVACSNRDESSHPQVDEHGHGEASDEFERGPHNGRLVEHDDFAVEVTIFETGVEPEFRLYLYDSGKPLAPTAASVEMKLTRLDGATNTYTFTPEADFLRGSGVVAEPHSFDVEVTAQRDGETAHWTYASYEGRATIADATAA